ncbi:hypothetical protein HPP92_025535 [Vanilla planifolia]|uniref:Cytochrome c1 n=1 Tax=Vanilla planifolia TaxID=51239 RepID=A0A835PL71_VANPL|nr:hypothetical protein HPP92_025535 [Vanilla planifolia]
MTTSRRRDLLMEARHDGQNYVLSSSHPGYRDPPAGVSIRDGLHYNPYFPGGAIAMPKMLIDGAMEYEDGTPATEAQMGKDVVSFLSWAAEPEMEERKLMGFKWIFVLSLALLQAAYYRRLKWSVLKSASWSSTSSTDLLPEKVLRGMQIVLQLLVRNYLRLFQMEVDLASSIGAPKFEGSICIWYYIKCHV